MKKITRAYKLPLFHNSQKWEVVRYTEKEYKTYLSAYTNRQIFENFVDGESSKFSTFGLGVIANIASNDAKGRAKSIIESANSLQDPNSGIKLNPPNFSQFTCPGKIVKNKNSASFSHWIVVSGAHNTTTYLPTRLTKPARKKLSKGWKLSDRVDIKNGYIICYLTKEKPKLKLPDSDECLGADVNYKNSVVTSDGVFGFNLRKRARRATRAQKERSRQKHKVKCGNSRQTQVKQLLDIEANRYVARCKRVGKSPAIETMGVIANLRGGKMPRWACTHFQKRVMNLCEEEGIKVFEVHPAFTSQECSCCGHVEKANRVKGKFKCKMCGHMDHADLNSAKNIAVKGSRAVKAYRDTIAKTTRLKSQNSHDFVGFVRNSFSEKPISPFGETLEELH